MKGFLSVCFSLKLESVKDENQSLLHPKWSSYSRARGSEQLSSSFMGMMKTNGSPLWMLLMCTDRERRMLDTEL